MSLYDVFRNSGLLSNGAKPSKFLAVVWVPMFSEGDSITGSVFKAITSTGKTAKLALSCKSASLPQSTIGKVDISLPGNQKVRLAGDRAFDEELSLVAYNDQDFYPRNSLENWIEKIQHNESGTPKEKANAIAETYKSTAYVLQLGDFKIAGSGGAAGALGGAVLGSAAGFLSGDTKQESLESAAYGAVTGLAAGLGLPTPIYVYRFHGVFPTSVQSIPLDWGSSDQIEEFTINFSYDYFDVDLNLQNIL